MWLNTVQKKIKFFPLDIGCNRILFLQHEIPYFLTFDHRLIQVIYLL